jgi:hypothetical protein
MYRAAVEVNFCVVSRTSRFPKLTALVLFSNRLRGTTGVEPVIVRLIV